MTINKFLFDLFNTMLSMRWEKLCLCVLALEYVEIQLRESREQDVSDVYMKSCDSIGFHYIKISLNI